MFETNGGSLCAPITLDESETLTLPENPSKDGYLFEGWYIDPEFNVVFSIDQLDNLEDQTLVLYAKWSITDSELTLMLKHIYQLALDSDYFEGTYEEWLETVRGPQGLPGEDGKTPYIGENGNWFIDKTDTGVFAGYYYPSIPITGEFIFAVNSDGESYYILSYEGFDRYIEIPKYYQGYPVTSIGDNVFQDNEVVEHVFISNLIIDIGDYAFSGTTHLENVTIEEGSQLEIIGDYAFNEANILKSISIPHTVTYIGSHAFYNTLSLASVTIEDNSQLTTIGSYAFSDARSLSSIIIPSGVTRIEEFTFYRTLALHSLTFAENSQLKYIGYAAFFGNTSLTDVILPEGLEEIGGNAFQSTTQLISVHIPASVHKIGSYAFASTSLETITFAENSQLEKIENETFNFAYELRSITIPANVISIGDYAFFEASKLETVTFEQGSKLQSIGISAFSECDSITIIIVPPGVTSIYAYAFYLSNALTSVYIPLSVTFMGHSVFGSSTNLTIYVEATSKPSRWETDWNPYNKPVIWGYSWA